ncbi:MAG: hypothetical protein RLZZ385_2051 [Pseudomonadota bacterium]|jgi:ribosome biogenesis GTPase A
MPINWFPGHMHKARKELAKAMSGTDVLIEVLDARTPAASSNPLLAELRGQRPCVRILNKADLADPAVTGRWLEHFRAQPASTCLVNGLDQKLTKDDLIAACERFTGKGTDSPGAQPGKTRQAFITGIPNVGKSTLLNQIVDRKLAKTRNEPAVTKGQQRVRLNEHWTLIDTPGLLWPKLADQAAAYRLACTGTIRNTAVEAEDVAWFAAEMLLEQFYPQLAERYRLTSKPEGAEQLLLEIGRQRGCIGKQGAVDWHKIAEQLLNDFRSGKIGRLSLELPPAATHHQPESTGSITEPQ